MTTAGTLTLTDFLLARIAEDEAAAKGVYSLSEFWRTSPGWHDMGPGVAYFEEPADVEHVVRWAPARVLAECEAKRRIVAMGDGSADFHQGVLARDGYQPFHTPSIDVLTRVQQLLALPYADHPDYRPEWAV